MKIKNILAVGVVALSLAFSAQSANAALSAFDFTGNNVNIGTVSAGDSGVIGNIGHFGQTVISQVSGTLPANSMITFTYDFSGNLNFGSLGAFGEYAYNDSGDQFTGFATGSNVTGSNAGGFVNGSPSTALAVASAQVDFASNTATAVIQNNSAGAVSFLDLFVGLVTGSQDLTIAYSVSAVPLPAALPLLGAALASLMGFSYRRKKMAVAAA